MKNLIKIEDVFATFHDGTIESWSGNKDKLMLKVSCEYLAEILDETFEYFYLELIQVDKLELLTFSNNENTEANIIRDLNEIFSEDIEILYANNMNNYIQIDCWQANDKKNYVANSLLLDCKDVKIYNQNKQEITSEKLFEIIGEYWSRFGRK